jgi:hypothetical protein
MCFKCSMCCVAGDVLVILDLHADNSLFEAGAAREVYTSYPFQSCEVHLLVV